MVNHELFDYMLREHDVILLESDEAEITNILKAKNNKDKKLDERNILDLGFKLKKTYEHDYYITNRYSNGILEVEFTYKEGFLVTCDVTIQEINCLPIEFNQLLSLTEIFKTQ